MGHKCAEVVRASVIVCLLLSTNEGVEAVATAGTQMAPEQLRSVTHVRTLDPVLAAAVERGMEESPVFATIVSRLEHAPIIVYLAREKCPGRRVVGCVVSVSAGGRVRFISHQPRPRA